MTKKQFLNILILSLLCFSITQAQKLQIVRWPQVENILNQESDTTFILNFWATWCKPCVVELPDFEQIHQDFSTQKVKVVLISMDFVKEFSTRVVPFVEQRRLQSNVWLLNEPDANAWINKISHEWSGAIPATLILNNKKQKKVFFEQKMTYQRLEKELADFL
ncbi:MAG: TlpA family protein disulfide reductase [Runella sp.]